jgi:hypothetical protein
MAAKRADSIAAAGGGGRARLTAKVFLDDHAIRFKGPGTFPTMQELRCPSLLGGSLFIAHKLLYEHESCLCSVDPDDLYVCLRSAWSDP